MLVPSSNNNISIVVNYKLNLLQVTCLDTMTFAEIKSLTIILELCKAIFALYMYVYRVMLFTIERLIRTFAANIDIVFYICKLFSK